jgi:hypothetical protein
MKFAILFAAATILLVPHAGILSDRTEAPAPPAAPDPAPGPSGPTGLPPYCDFLVIDVSDPQVVLYHPECLGIPPST